jgi:tetratricopeptide (TPR) repeat protein
MMNSINQPRRTGAPEAFALRNGSQKTNTFMFPINLKRIRNIAFGLILQAGIAYGQSEKPASPDKPPEKDVFDSAVPLLLSPANPSSASATEARPLGGLKPVSPESAQPGTQDSDTAPDQGLEIQRNPMEAAAELFAQQANVHAAAGRLDMALERIQNAIRLAPEDFRFYITLGNILVRGDRLDQAREAYEAALYAAPKSQIAACNFATVLAAQGFVLRALYVLQKAHERQPDHALTNINLGAVYAMLGKDQLAIDYWKLAAKSTPGLLLDSFQDPLLRDAMLRPALQTFAASLSEPAAPEQP